MQHASNPVDWYPWSSEAFARAERENKPIFLSIGYSTCHWCHVMEHESFEDEEVAKLLNKHFVSIKVDREERPDIDQAYMQVCQMLTGRGGWPLSVFMTPDKKPFHAGTYYPKYSRQLAGGVSLGMLDLLTHITKVWNDDKQRVLKSAEDIYNYARKGETRIQPNISLAFEQKSDLQILARSLYQQAFDSILQKFDKEYGGFGSAPKFPTPHILSYLLRYASQLDSKQALELVDKTLLGMRQGGIFDQIGFGFHRYSTDREWLVPHFEKMLYDQALIMIAFADAFRFTSNSDYKNVIQEIFIYLQRDLYSPQGGFYSAEDADSEGVEGKFYTWSYAELQEAFQGQELDKFCDKYQISSEGNFHDELSGKKTSKNILHLRTLSDLDHELGALSARLLECRSARVRPLRDDKILLDWNALLVVALSKAYGATGDKQYLDQALLTYDFLNDNLRDHANKKLFKSCRNGKFNENACLNDYAFLTWAAMEIFTATCDERYLQDAQELMNWTLARFWDENEGAFYLADKSSEDLPFKNKEFYDGAIPSGNSVLFMIMLRLEKISPDNSYSSQIAKLAAIFIDLVEQYPPGYTQFLVALDYLFEESKFNQDLRCGLR